MVQPFQPGCDGESPGDGNKKQMCPWVSQQWPRPEASTEQLLPGQLGMSGSAALLPMGDSNLPGISWECHSAPMSSSGTAMSWQHPKP